MGVAQPGEHPHPQLGWEANLEEKKLIQKSHQQLTGSTHLVFG
jgi:hypothetical protein